MRTLQLGFVHLSISVSRKEITALIKVLGFLSEEGQVKGRRMFSHQRVTTNYRIGIRWAPPIPTLCRLEQVSHLSSRAPLMIDPQRAEGHCPSAHLLTLFSGLPVPPGGRGRDGVERL